MKRDSRSRTAATGGARNNLSTKCLRGTAMALVLAAIAIPALAGQVVTDHVISESGHAQTNVPVTFGQVFKDGAVPRGATLTATLGGHPIALQVDPKATNPDGSLRHAVLTLTVPALRGHADLPLTLSTGSATAASQPITLSDLLATGYNAVASIKLLDGTVYTANARALLQAAAKAGTCKAWNRYCNVWLSGPQASEWVVTGSAKATNGSAAPNLEIYFAVRAYAGDTPGSIGRVRADIVVENSNAFAPQGQPQYTATLTSGKATYTSPALTQYAYTRWHKVLWWNADRPDVYLRQNTQYIQATKAVSRYMKLTPDPKFLASLRQTCAPLQHCDQTQKMANTGAQASIGPLPRWTSVYIVDPDIRAYRWMLANTDALGAYSIHYRDAATGYPVSIRKHPYTTVIAWADANRTATRDTAAGKAYARDLLPNCVNNTLLTKCTTAWYSTGNPNVWDNAHQPAQSYIPYMVTGSWYYMSELAAAASYNELWSNDGYRGYAKGLIGPAHSQVRGKAWTLRQMVDAAWLLPDLYPLKSEFTSDVENSLHAWNKKYTDNPAANPLHALNGSVISNVNGGRDNGLSPWQHNFFTWSVGHAASLDFRGAKPLLIWLSKFEIAMMTGWQVDPTEGYCWLEASAYNIQVKDAAGAWLPNFSSVYRATFPTLAGLACNSPPMINAMAKLERAPWRAGQMHGYATSATGFPSNLQIGLASAADSGLPGSHAAWTTFESRAVKPQGATGYDNDPNFAIVPRPSVTVGPLHPMASQHEN